MTKLKKCICHKLFIKNDELVKCPICSAYSLGSTLSTDQIQTYKRLLEFMKSAKNVYDWNQLREQAKEKFGMVLISRLDASGLIVKVLKNESC